jgi:glucose-6-phosphate isomerase
MQHTLKHIEDVLDTYVLASKQRAFKKMLRGAKKGYDAAMKEGNLEIAAYQLALVALASADTDDSHKNVLYMITPDEGE